MIDHVSKASGTGMARYPPKTYDSLSSSIAVVLIDSCLSNLIMPEPGVRGRLGASRASPRPRAPEQYLETIAWLMDRSIRIGPWSFGLDGIIGLVPGIGDAASGVVSSIIVIAGIQAGLPKAAILRMMLNVGIDSVLGSIPFVG